MKSILLLLIIALLGCSSNMKQEPISKSGIPVINLSEDVSTVPSLLLSEAASKVDIVPLEVTDESLLGGNLSSSNNRERYMGTPL